MMHYQVYGGERVKEVHIPKTFVSLVMMNLFFFQ